jgi:hypothetical protein
MVRKTFIIIPLSVRLWAVRRRWHRTSNQHTSFHHATCKYACLGGNFSISKRFIATYSTRYVGPFFVALLWLRIFGLGNLVDVFDCLYMIVMHVICHSAQHSGVRNPYKSSVPFLCRSDVFHSTVVLLSSWLYGGRLARVPGNPNHRRETLWCR